MIVLNKLTINRYLLPPVIIFFFINQIACEIHSIIDFENYELPSRAIPSDLSHDLVKKYSINNIIVLPSVRHSLKGDNWYYLRFDIFSHIDINYLTIVNANLYIESEPVFGRNGISFSNIEFDDPDDKFIYHHGYVKSPSFFIKNPINIKDIESFHTIELPMNGQNYSQTISTIFYPKIRRYIE